MVDFDLIWHRLLEAAKADNNVQLAEFLGLRPQTVSKAKRAQRIPNSWWVTFREKTGVTWEELNRGVPQVPAQIAVANGVGNHVGNSVGGGVAAASGGGEIVQDLCERIAQHLEGKTTDERIEFRARVRELMEEKREQAQE